MNERVWEIGCLYVLVSSLTMTSIANAACTPTPDCASIGYTETSCETDYLACPFDSTKLKCIPCDSSFRYDCTDENTTKGIGNVCNGKYTSCICKDAQLTFHNGKCLCLTSDCLVGAIYYSDGTCSACVDDTKIAIGIVVKENELVMSKVIKTITWASNTQTDTPLTNIGNSADYDGKYNTNIIVSSYPDDTIDNNAAVYCNNYSTIGTNTGDWYLPSAGELVINIANNYKVLKPVWDNKLAMTPYDRFLSSTETSKAVAVRVNSNGGIIYHTDKINNHPVTCFLHID